LKYNLLRGEPWLFVNLAIVLAPWLAHRRGVAGFRMPR
jgi:hypothetical protein